MEYSQMQTFVQKKEEDSSLDLYERGEINCRSKFCMLVKDQLQVKALFKNVCAILTHYTGVLRYTALSLFVVCSHLRETLIYVGTQKNYSSVAKTCHEKKCTCLGTMLSDTFSIHALHFFIVCIS